MAYKFNPGKETVEESLRRIAAERFDRILSTLADPDMPDLTKVHEVRKSVKRIRSLIRLVGPTLLGAKDENACLRDAARSLSELRDTGAVVDTLPRLGLSNETFTKITHALTHSHTAPHNSQHASTLLLQNFTQTIETAAARAQTWSPEKTGFDALAPGLERSFRRLKKAYEIALETGEEEALHDWRKAAKIHWHQTLLLRRIAPEILEMHAQIAARTSAALGDWRDAILILQAVDSLPAEALGPDVRKAVLKAANRLQKASLKSAHADTGSLLAESPSALSLRWAAYWRLEEN